MNSKRIGCAAQACAGCGTTTFGPASAAVLDDLGRYLGAACGPCCAKAAESPALREAMERAALIGVPLKEIQHLFETAGLAMPASADDVARLLAKGAPR